MTCIRIPSSKSDGQRAVLAAALCEGKSFIYNLGKSDDELKMLEVIQQIGANVKFDASNNSYEIVRTDILPKKASLNVGESGLACRLITCVCAAIGGEFLIEGKGTLKNRSMNFFNVHFNTEKLSAELSIGGRLPIRLSGQLSADSIEVDGSESSQYISGLLMAIPLLNRDVTLIVNNLVSKPYVDMTISTLKSFGITIRRTENNFYFNKLSNYLPTSYNVEGDWSSASYWLVASALGVNVSVAGLSLDSKQADKNILVAFSNAGCSVHESQEGLVIDGSNKKSFSFDATECPDLFPSLVAFASFCKGISVIKGVSRLKNKESDRGSVLQLECAKIGIRIDLKGDNMLIHGGENVKGGKIHSHNDHRIAMAFGVIGLLIKEEIVIENPEAVSKSYPVFWEDLLRVKHNS